MKKPSSQLLVSLLILFFCVTPVMAANNQGLSWGIFEGQRFDYNISGVTLNEESYDIDYYIIVDSLPVLPDDIGSGVYFDRIERTCYHMNGTEMDLGYIWYALPVGNWEVFTVPWMSASTVSIDDIIDTPDLIGYNATWTFGNDTHVYSEVYLKSSGVLSSLYQYNDVISLGFPVYHRITLLGSSINPIILALVSIGIIAVIGIGVVIFKMKK